MSVKKKSVVFTKDLDLTLLKIVHGRNPYADGKLWELVAGDFTEYVKQELGENRPNCTVRTVKNRTKKLVEDCEKAEKESKKLSGVNEEYGEKEEILTDLLSYIEEARLAQEEQKQKNNDISKSAKEKKMKTIKDIEDGKKIREAAMKSYATLTDSDGSNQESDEERHNNEDSDSRPESDKEQGRKKKGNRKAKLMETQKKTKKKQKRTAPTDPILELLRRKIDLDERKEKRRRIETKLKVVAAKNNHENWNFDLLDTDSDSD